MSESVTMLFTKGLLKRYRKQVKEYRSQFEEHPDHFRCSQIGQCMAKQYYDWKYRDSETQPTYSTMIRVSDGTMQHQHIREILRAGGARLADEEKPVTLEIGGLVLNGHIDNTIVLNGQKFVIDYKKASEVSAKIMVRQSLPRTYLWSMQAYLHAMNLPLGIVFVKPDGGDSVLEFLVQKSSSMMKAILENLHVVARSRKTGRRPKREYAYNQYPCTYCPYRSECWDLEHTPDRKVAEVNPSHSLYLKAERIFERAQKAQSLLDESKALDGKARNGALNLLDRLKVKKAIVSGLGTISMNPYLRIVPGK